MRQARYDIYLIVVAGIVNITNLICMTNEFNVKIPIFRVR